MFDLFVFIDRRERQREIKALFGLSAADGEEGGGREIPGERFYLDFDRDMLKHYSDDELRLIPYPVYSVCSIAFYPFDEVIYFLLDALENYDSTLFVDDDHDNVMNIVRYRKKVKNKDVYPFVW